MLDAVVLAAVAVEPLAALRIFRVIEDPEIDGADPWLVGSTFEADWSREATDKLIDLMIEEGAVEERDGLLYPTPHLEA